MVPNFELALARANDVCGRPTSAATQPAHQFFSVIRIRAAGAGSVFAVAPTVIGQHHRGSPILDHTFSAIGCGDEPL